MNDNVNFTVVGEDECVSFTYTDEDGRTTVYKMLLTFTGDDHDYIVFTDHSTDDDGNVIAFAARYNPNDTHSPLSAIETDEEWALVEEALALAKDIATDND